MFLFSTSKNSINFLKKSKKRLPEREAFKNL